MPQLDEPDDSPIINTAFVRSLFQIFGMVLLLMLGHALLTHRQPVDEITPKGPIANTNAVPAVFRPQVVTIYGNLIDLQSCSTDPVKMAFPQIVKLKMGGFNPAKVRCLQCQGHLACFHDDEGGNPSPRAEKSEFAENAIPKTKTKEL